MSRKTGNYVLQFSMGVSIFGLILVLMFAINPPMTYENFPWRKPLVGSIFSLICILGILAALSPRHCSDPSHFRKDKMDSASQKVSVTSKGHHPICKEFSAHVIRTKSHILCAACTGLFLGALTTLLGTAFYFFNEWSIKGISFTVVLLGIGGLVLGFLQLKFSSFIRLIMNIFFVAGAFLILVGIDAIIESLFIDFFVIAFIIFWIFTRIQLSRWDHQRICDRCKLPCEVYEEANKG